jgi:RNA polymerase sigma-70 factor (ECF subfamily)
VPNQNKIARFRLGFVDTVEPPRYKIRTPQAKAPEAVSDQVTSWPSVPAKSRSGGSCSPNAGLLKLSDAELMGCLQNGEQDALSHLFDRYHRLVLNVARKIIHDRAEAEDVMQDVFFDIFRVANKFDPARGTAKGWIIQFTYYKSLRRRKYLALRGAFSDPQIRALDPPEASYSPFGPQSNGHDSDDVLEIVQKGLAALNPKQREVVQLACFEGLLLSEIATRTKESLGNVRHHYYRGIGKLRDHVKQNLCRDESERGAARRGRL